MANKHGQWIQGVWGHQDVWTYSSSLLFFLSKGFPQSNLQGIRSKREADTAGLHFLANWPAEQNLDSVLATVWYGSNPQRMGEELWRLTLYSKSLVSLLHFSFCLRQFGSNVQAPGDCPGWALWKKHWPWETRAFFYTQKLQLLVHSAGFFFFFKTI